MRLKTSVGYVSFIWHYMSHLSKGTLADIKRIKNEAYKLVRGKLCLFVQTTTCS
jgi:hypothetical protein